jgi:hypothetical protein
VQGLSGKLVKAEEQHAQIQPFPVHFRNNVVKLTPLCSFFQAMEQNGAATINTNK